MLNRIRNASFFEHLKEIGLSDDAHSKLAGLFKLASSPLASKKARRLA